MDQNQAWQAMQADCERIRQDARGVGDGQYARKLSVGASEHAKGWAREASDIHNSNHDPALKAKWMGQASDKLWQQGQRGAAAEVQEHALGHAHEASKAANSTPKEAGHLAAAGAHERAADAYRAVGKDIEAAGHEHAKDAHMAGDNDQWARDEQGRFASK